MAHVHKAVCPYGTCPQGSCVTRTVLVLYFGQFVASATMHSHLIAWLPTIHSGSSLIDNRVRVRLTSQITLHRICADSHRRTWTFIWNFISDDWSFCIVGIWRISCSDESLLLKVTATMATPHVILVWVHLYVFNPHNAVGDLHVSRCSFPRPWPERIFTPVAIQVSAWQCNPIIGSASRESRGPLVFAAPAFAATAHGENCPN